MGYSLNYISELGAPFQVIHEQIVDTAPNSSHTVVNHARKLLFVLSGECRHQIMGWDGPWGNTHLRPGDVLALPHRCEQRYSGVEVGRASRLHVIRLSFDPERLPALTLGSENAVALPTPQSDALAWAAYSLREIRCHHAAGDAALTETLLHLRAEAERRLPGYRLRIHGLCVGLTILFARAGDAARLKNSQPNPRQEGSEYPVGKIKSYLRGHLRQPVRLAEIAAFVGLREEYIARLFRQTTGMTIFEYLRRLRIAEAKSLLAATDNNLSEVAQKTGYSSLTVFSRNFTQKEGMTPSEFRREIARQIG